LTLRIFDRVASGENIIHHKGQAVAIEITMTIRRAANTYVRIIGDEAAQFMAQTDTSWITKRGDFGMLRPPFADMWIEYKMPNSFIVDGEWQPAFPRDQRYAVLAQENNEGTLHLFGIFTNGDRSPLALFPIAVDLNHLDDPACTTEQGNWISPGVDLARKFDSQEEAFGAMMGLLVPAYLTIGWLNCRGMRTEEHKVGARLASRRVRKGQPVGLDYRRIVVDDRLRAALERNRRAEAEGKRLHIVRGHIRTYTKERPAFGNYVGNMWIHQHMRGESELGQINHEYHVQSRGPR
jgi:hypothetical protein